MPDLDYARFKEAIRRQTGIDLDAYKQQQMERRLRSLLESRRIATFTQYLDIINHDPGEYRRFLDRITINVSEFFRNPEKFRELSGAVLPELLKNNHRLAAWSAGCSSGEEPYSLAMLLEEAAPGSPWQILATDMDETVLQRSREGVYPEKQLTNVSPSLRERYFNREGDLYRVKDRLKAKIRFSRHNLLADPYPARCDLILCRNVLIYFTDAAKEKLYPQFAAALRPGGFFLTGSTESIFNPERFGLEAFSSFVYRRR